MRGPNIDAHQHFWRLSRGDYGWLTPDLEVLYPDFEPADLLPLMEGAGVELAGGYAAWREASLRLLADFTADERTAILGGNAARVYQLD